MTGSGAGPVLELAWGGGGDGCGWGKCGPGQKTSNLSPCPVPLVVKPNVKCQGSVKTDACAAKIWFTTYRWIQRLTARGAVTPREQN